MSETNSKQDSSSKQPVNAVTEQTTIKVQKKRTRNTKKNDTTKKEKTADVEQNTEVEKSDGDVAREEAHNLTYNALKNVSNEDLVDAIKKQSDDINIFSNVLSQMMSKLDFENSKNQKKTSKKSSKEEELEEDVRKLKELIGHLYIELGKKSATANDQERMMNNILNTKIQKIIDVSSSGPTPKLKEQSLEYFDMYCRNISVAQPNESSDLGK